MPKLEGFQANSIFISCENQVKNLPFIFFIVELYVRELVLCFESHGNQSKTLCSHYILLVIV